MISPHNISVVVQGPIVGKPTDPSEQRYTLRCINSIRKHLPGAEIVLSTWRGSDLLGLSYDILVESDDPGGWNCRKEGEPSILFNINRQIATTRAGLLAATRPYAVKIRSDMVFTGTGFLNYFRKYQVRSSAWKILRDRVITPTVYARNPRRTWAFPFHPSDWFFFGWREDLLNIWDIPFSREPETSRWFETHHRPTDDCDPGAMNRYNPEQYMWVSFLRKHGEVPFEHKSDFRYDALSVSELTIANNLVVAELKQLGVKSLKTPTIIMREWASLYSHGEWLRLYGKYCHPGIRYPLDVALWRKKLYYLITTPGSHFRWGSKITRGWEEKSPATFHAVRNAYISILSAFNRETGSQ